MLTRVIKLGTRRSLLAWAQSSWVAREVERLNLGIKVELVGIDTRGDKILDISLQGVEGKEFFVAELDDALRSGAVDFTVHSMKDLSLDRPAEFMQAAIPKRENPRDVVIFGPQVVEKIRRAKKLRIGTSSPRRMENIPSFLEKALPRYSSGPVSVELIEIRGNVNTRLSRVQEPESSPKHLDGVVLAFAGLIRLAADEKANLELTQLLHGVRWMILPLKECPAAPAQGALAIECRSRREDLAIQEALAKLNDVTTALQVQKERNLLAKWGGGCHQKFGATCVGHKELGELLYIRGRKPDGAFVDELRWNTPVVNSSLNKNALRTWNGVEWRAQSMTAPVEKMPENKQRELINQIAEKSSVFIVHSRALPLDTCAAFEKKRVWTSGASSWFRLAQRGIWVEGCAEGMGFDFIDTTLKEKVLALPPFNQWIVLTHEAAVEGWIGECDKAEIIPTYRVESPDDHSANEAKYALRNATHIYWSSGSQFDHLKDEVSSGAIHACGPGKTLDHIRASGINPLVFPYVEEWKKWVKT